LDDSNDYDLQLELLNVQLTELKNIMNYKDYCGSQEALCTALQKSTSRVKRNCSNSLKQSEMTTALPSTNETFFLQAESNSSYSTSPSTSLTDKLNRKFSSLSSSSQSSINSQVEYHYNSAFISDYRLTLTDLIELNLIDVTNGLIINPLNGSRLTIADAIRIDLLNSDIKEIANTFYLNDSLLKPHSSIKLTVKEAIQLGILNPNKNEIHLSLKHAHKKLNLYDARKRNYILKPLTLSEAFIRNLIQPNGFVRNPLNNKYYAFETIVSYSDSSKENLYETMYLFDFDTKHIIDPNDCEKRLLSLSEAIEIGLILPRTFELNLTYRQANLHHKLNLYDAFFNTNHLNLSLLLYKPEIENVYIKLALQSPHTNNTRFQTKLAMILSKRDKIGLIEAINLNIINLKKQTYTFLDALLENEFTNELNSEANNIQTNKIEISLADATFKYKLVDAELIELLNTPVANIKGKKCSEVISICDCINDSTLLLERYLFKNLFSNDYMQLDSHSCKTLLGEDIVKRMKRLITRINIKSYVISLNNTPSISMPIPLKSSKFSHHQPLTQLINVKTPTVVYNQIKRPSNNDNEHNSKKPFDNSKNEMSSLIKETKSFILEFVLDPDCLTSDVNGALHIKSDSKRLTVQEAKRRGILDVEKGVYIDKRSNVLISIDYAIRMGLIGARMSTCEKNVLVDENQCVENNSSTLTIESVKDAKSGLSYSISDAIKMGLIDQTNLLYRNTLNGQVVSLNDAFQNGFVKGIIYENASTSVINKNPNNLNVKTEYAKFPDSRRLLAECEESCFKINSIIDSKTGAKLSLDEAIRDGLFDKTLGFYVDPLTGFRMNLNEAYENGYIEVESMDKNHSNGTNHKLIIDVNNKEENKKDVLLYEVSEVNTVNVDDLKQERYEHVIDDDDDDDEEEKVEAEAIYDNELVGELPTNGSVSYRTKRRGLGPKIVERRISSMYGGENGLNNSETLIIDDVRHSAMLDIDGVTHIFKKEVLIDSDSNAPRNDSNIKKVNNRTVIIVDEQIIDNHNNSQSPTESYEPLKIMVKCDSLQSSPRINQVISFSIFLPDVEISPKLYCQIKIVRKNFALRNFELKLEVQYAFSTLFVLIF
jgi:hypothetical protein